jgi:hypothetical protein
MQEPPVISGFLPSFGEEGDWVVISGDWLGDVESLYLVDPFDTETVFTNWVLFPNPDPAYVQCPKGQLGGMGYCVDDYWISGQIPEGLPKTDIEKFPRFSIKAINVVGEHSKCCYEVKKDLYRIHDDLIVAGDFTFNEDFGIPSLPFPESDWTEFLVRGPAGAVRSRGLTDAIVGVAHESEIANLALSVQMNWSEFTTEFTTTETIDTLGNADSSQGLELARVAVEPLRADTYMLIDVDLCVTAGHSTDVCCALFKDDIHDDPVEPIKMWQVHVDFRDQLHTLRLRHIEQSVAAGEAHTYSIRVGVGRPGYYNYWGQVVYVNRGSGHPWSRVPQNIFGEDATSVVWVREMKNNPTLPSP